MIGSVKPTSDVCYLLFEIRGASSATFAITQCFYAVTVFQGLLNLRERGVVVERRGGKQRVSYFDFARRCDLASLRESRSPATEISRKGAKPQSVTAK